MKDERNTTPTADANQAKAGVKEYLNLGEVWGYFFRKKDPNRPTNFNIRAMHGINKLSMAIFLVGIIYMLFKHWL